MNDETQGPAEPGLTLPPTKPASPEPATRWRGAAPRRRGLAPFAAARWRRTSARRGARGLFVTHWRWLILVTLVVVRRCGDAVVLADPDLQVGCGRTRPAEVVCRGHRTAGT